MKDYKIHVLSVHFPLIPISVNDLYSGKAKKERLISGISIQEMIEEWRTTGVDIVKAAMAKKSVSEIKGAVAIDINIAPMTQSRRYNLNNYLKMPLDTLEKSGLIKDDVAVVEINAKRGALGSGVFMNIYKMPGKPIYWEAGDRSRNVYSVNVGDKNSYYWRKKGLFVKKRVWGLEELSFYLSELLNINDDFDKFFVSEYGTHRPTCSKKGAEICWESGGKEYREYLQAENHPDFINKFLKLCREKGLRNIKIKEFRPIALRPYLRSKNV